MNFRKIWNNRTFRTFVQTFLGVIAAYFADYTFEIESKKVMCIIIMAIATAFTKIMPLLDESIPINQDAKVEENAVIEKQEAEVQEEAKNG